MRCAYLLMLTSVACGSTQPHAKSPCETVAVRVDDGRKFELPARAEYCLYAPDPVACCAGEDTHCEQLADEGHTFFVERAPGCKAPSSTGQ